MDSFKLGSIHSSGGLLHDSSAGRELNSGIAEAAHLFRGKSYAPEIVHNSLSFRESLMFKHLAGMVL